MNNIRQIITERLENARNDWLLDKRDYLRGQMVSYRDCLNLIEQNFNNSQLGIMNSQELTFYANKPAPRTEQDILNDFEKLGYEVIVEKDHIRMSGYEDVCLYIDLENKSYSKNKYLQAEDLTIQEHKLLNELFICWGWL